MKRKEITAEEADALWRLGASLWFYTDIVGEWRECENCAMEPFWQRWVDAVQTENPKIAVEVE